MLIYILGITILLFMSRSVFVFFGLISMQVLQSIQAKQNMIFLGDKQHPQK